MRTWVAIWTIFAALAVGFIAGAQTSNTPRPKYLADVRPGMQREAVLSGLSEGYDLRRLSYPPGTATTPEERESEDWVVASKRATEEIGEVAHITFWADKVTHITEFLTHTYNPDTAKFVRELFTYLEAHAQAEPNNRTSGMNAVQRGHIAATLDLEATSLPIGSGQVIAIRLKDVIYQLSVGASSDAPSPIVQIMRVRGQ